MVAGQYPVSLSDDEWRVFHVLQSCREAMTLRQLERSLTWSRVEVQDTLDALLGRNFVTRLNTVVPSYICRYGAIDPGPR